MQINIITLINKYIDSATNYGESICAGDSKLSDKYFDKIEKVFQDIKSLEDTGLDEIAKLFNHENEGVRLWSSSHLLNYPKYESYKVLEMIRDSGTILGLTAEMTLDQWKNGNINH